MSNKLNRGFGSRPYNFFDRQPVAENLTGILGSPCVSVVSFEGLLVLGDEAGNVTFTDSDLRVSIQQKMIGGPAALLARSRQTPPLFVVAGPESGGAVVVKTWVGSKLASPANTFDINQLLKGAYPLEVTALACNFDGTKVALGFKSGLLVLLEGELGRDRCRLKPPVVVPPSSPLCGPISNLHFLHPSDAPQPPATTTAAGPANVHKLYVLFDLSSSSSSQPPTPADPAEGPSSASSPRGGILVYNTADLKARPVVLDEVGCAKGCSGVDRGSQDLVVGRPDAMYFYSHEEGNKGAKGFEVKQALTCVGAGSVLWATVDGPSGRSSLSVYDLRNQFVALHALLPTNHQVTHLVSEGSVVYVFTSQGQVLRLKEKHIADKLKILVEDMKLFGVAIKLAYSSNYDVAKIMDIYKLYGDYLYEKKRAYDSAMVQYCHTIGHVDPSYVMSRFLDAQRIKNLTTYLEALHRRGQHTPDLTTFLLHCYTKLKDVEKLERFIHQDWHTPLPDPTPASDPAADGSEPPAPPISESVNTAARRRALLEGGGGAVESDQPGFDIDNAIQVLKSAGYPDHALELARKYKAHDWYLRIQLEKPAPSYRDALLYMSTLPFASASVLMRTYGKRLLTALPDDTTALLIALCIGRFQSLPTPPGGGAEVNGARSTDPPPPPLHQANTGAAGGERARAEDYLHLFVDHQTHLRTFLQCVMREPAVIVSPCVANTLLELLVQDWAHAHALPDSDEAARSRAKRSSELMSFLEGQHGRYDEDHALVLLQMHRFRPGSLFLHDKLRHMDLVLDHLIQEADDVMRLLQDGDTANVLHRICRKENKKNAHLWAKVLTYVVDAAAPPSEQEGGPPPPDKDRGARSNGGGAHSASNGDGASSDEDSDEEEARWDDVIKVLQMLEKEQVLPPLQVLDILSRSASMPLLVVRDYVSRLLREAYADVHASQNKIDSLRQSTMEMRSEVDSLRSTARVFQATKCHGCPRALEVPAVHFLCMHSYHQDPNLNCMDRENECNECAPEHRKYEGISKAQSGKAMDHEHFFSELEEHGFAAVASYFGKGVIK